MKLSRFLSLSIGLIWLMVFVGTFNIAVGNSRQDLSTRLQSHAQDTARFLGLALSARARSDDVATTGAMVNSIFDQGFFSEITVRNEAGDIIAHRTQTSSTDEVPVWFVEHFDLAAPTAQSLIMDGWRQAGTVEVTSHSGHAYFELWRICKETSLFLALVCLFSFVLVLSVLRFALAPLRHMAEFARGIAERRFGTLNKMPWAAELREVASAMNEMSGKVKRMLDEDTKLAENLHKKAYVDEITGLPNFRLLANRLAQCASAGEEFQGGVLIMIHLQGFATFNARYGREIGNHLLLQAANALKKVFSDPANELLVRGNGAEFIALVDEMQANGADLLGRIIVDELQRSFLEADAAGLVQACVGLAYADKATSPDPWLAAADAALRTAMDKSSERWHCSSDLLHGEPSAPGGEDWRKLISTALQERKISLRLQAVLSVGEKRTIHDEALARISTAGDTEFAAEQFMPFIRRAGLGEILDRQVITLALSLLVSGKESKAIAVNLCSASLKSEDFLTWLCKGVEIAHLQTGQLSIEISEQDFVAQTRVVENAFRRLALSGVRFGIDRFGHDAAAIGLLHRIGVSYIKIDSSHIRRIDDDKDSQFFVQAVSNIAHGLGVQVIATGVEAGAELMMLRQLGIDAAQGNFLGRPR